MRVKINRNMCSAQLAFCERCLGQFLRFPMGYERHCFEEQIDDNSEMLTLEIHTGTDDIVLELNEEQRKLVAGEGWSAFVDNYIPMYRNNQKKAAE